jgi:prophage DNA circulation protein
MDVMTIMLAMALSIAGGRANWRARRDARRARSRISAAGDDGLAAASKLGGDGADLYSWLSLVVETSCRLVSDIAADAVPIVRVSTNLSLPSTVLAYQLYGDASRAADLVDIAGAATPLVMPSSFDALAS